MRSLLWPFLVFAPILAAGQSPEVAKLRTEAEAKTKQIGELAQSGKLPTNDEALKLLQQLVSELGEIRERLKRLEAAKGTTPPPPPQKVRWGGYTQFQYTDTNRKGASTFDAFRFRRVRIGFDADVDTRVAARVTFDLASGPAQTNTQIRDAWAVYDFSGGSKLGRDRGWFGQMPVDLGYELLRSSADREVPERSQYNQLYFPTERSRGLRIRRDGRTGVLQAGLYNALTISDPEQANLSSGPGNELVGFLGARWTHRRGSVGVSTLFGDRPPYTANNATSPETRRRFNYLDAELRNVFTPRLTLRGELVNGHDRLPNATAAPTRVGRDLAAYHLMGVYQLSSIDRFSMRWEHLDPDTDSGGNALHGIAASYVRDLTPASRIMLAHEVFVDQAREAQRQKRYGLTTIRLQVRF